MDMNRSQKGTLYVFLAALLYSIGGLCMKVIPWSGMAINGKQVGQKKLKNDCIARFHCVYEDGTIEAVSYDEAGKELGRCQLHTAGECTQLRAVPEQAKVKPSGLCYIRLQYTDEAGTVKPLERGILQVEVEGGQLLGLGSACPYNEIGFCGTTTDTYYGEAMAIVRAGESGQVELRVTDGTYSAQASVQVQ
jgi:beta-galactosidase